MGNIMINEVGTMIIFGILLWMFLGLVSFTIIGIEIIRTVPLKKLLEKPLWLLLTIVFILFFVCIVAGPIALYCSYRDLQLHKVKDCERKNFKK